jgi:hypothetical protein
VIDIIRYEFVEDQYILPVEGDQSFLIQTGEIGTI